MLKKYMCGTLPFTALQVNPTVTTSAAEKPGNVKKVHRVRKTDNGMNWPPGGSKIPLFCCTLTRNSVKRKFNFPCPHDLIKY